MCCAHLQKVGGQRDKRVKKSTKRAVVTKRKEYNTAKAAAKKLFTTQKNAFYKSENEKIKKMPAKQRKAARQKLRQQIKAKHAGLLKQLPAAGKLKFGEITKLISRAKSLKW